MAAGHQRAARNGAAGSTTVWGRLHLFAPTWSRCALLGVLAAAGGCATDGSGTSLARKMTPSFMLTDQEKAERKLKDPASLNVAYGRFQERTGQPAEAHKSYEMALRDDPKSLDAVLGLARLDQLSDKPKEAEAGFRRALQLKPGDPVVLAACGQFYASQKRWPEAFEKYSAAIAAAPKETGYKHQLAIAKTRSGDINGGIALFTELVGPEQAHYNVAYLLKQQRKPDAAARECKLALALNPNFEPARSLYQQIKSRPAADKSGRPQADRTAEFAAASPKAAPSTAPAGQRGTISQTGLNQPAVNQAASNGMSSGLQQTSWQPNAPAETGSAATGRSDATFAPSSAPSGAANGNPKDLWSKISGDAYPVY